jgi:hypothetical protein
MKKYWWVNHKQTFRQEIDGGYLWSPKAEKNGARSQFYNNMRMAAPDDVVLSYANAQIAFVGRVVDYALTGPKPEEFGVIGASWSAEGWLLPIAWQSLAVPVRPKDSLGELSPLLPKKYSPMHLVTGSGNQKAYLAEISFSLFEAIAKKGGIIIAPKFEVRQDAPVYRDYSEQLDQTMEWLLLASHELSSTEKEQLIKARRGQGIFRENVQSIETRCRLTGISNPNLLIASHIKPWRSCIDANERLDGNNGLLLTPHVDLLFDRGFISFQDNGGILVSARLNLDDLKRLGLTDHIASSSGKFLPEQCVYLAYHRANVFLS